MAGVSDCITEITRRFVGGVSEAENVLVKNSEIVVTIDSLGSEGQGIGRVDGMAVFVPFALPGESVRAIVIKREKRYAVAKLIEVLTPAPERVEPPCPYFGRCGGCALQHMDYAAQLVGKRAQIVDALERIGGIAGASEKVRECVGMADPWRYRNKAAFPVAPSADGVAIGMYAKRSHRVIPIADCLIQHASGVGALRAVTKWARTYGIEAYDETNGHGFLRHVIARNAESGESMVVLVTNDRLGAPFPHQNELIQALRAEIPGLRSVQRSHNDRRDNVIMGECMTPLWGDDRIDVTIAGMTYAVSAETFLQVNAEQTEKLYAAALAGACLTGSERVVDAYCGMGSMTLQFAKAARTVTGIEIVPRAVDDARANAARNGIENVQFVCAPAETELPRIVAEGPIDRLVLDPPRKGCDRALLDAAITSGCPRIVYVSCDPATLARDAAILQAGGYALESALPVDMFPHTRHVECVLVMTKRG